MPNQLIIFTGASGSGKTTLLEAVEARLVDSTTTFLHFDSIGVPELAEMERRFGSPEGWQKYQTIEWLHRIQSEFLPKSDVIFEGQMRIGFILEGLKNAGLSARITLIDCDDKTRTSRLVDDRNQPELANETMMNWAKFLRDEAKASGIEILDTTSFSKDQCVDQILNLLKKSRLTVAVMSRNK